MKKAYTIAAGLLLAAGLAGSALAGPGGNNGTIKIDGQPFDSHPNNEPHVGCSFQVDFAGFDHGDYFGRAIFDAHAPTGWINLHDQETFIGEDKAGGATDNDGTIQVDLLGALLAMPAHPNQGWHVKVTVHADGSQGADTKYKTFWVTGCEIPQ